MRKFACVLFFIVSLFVFGQSEAVPYVAPILPGHYDDVKIHENYLFVSCNNMVEIYDISSEPMEIITSLPARNFISDFHIHDNKVYIIAGTNDSNQGKFLYIYDISIIHSPILENQFNLLERELQENNLGLMFYNDIFVLKRYRSNVSMLGKIVSDSLELVEFNRECTITYMDSSLAIGMKYNKIYLWDISEFHSPILLDSLDCYASFCKNNLLAIRKTDSVLVLDISDTDSFSVISAINSSYTPIYIHDNNVFLFSNDSILYKYDIFEPTSPVGSTIVQSRYFNFNDSLFVNAARLYNLNSMEIIFNFSSDELDLLFGYSLPNSFVNSKLVYSINVESYRISDSMNSIGLILYDLSDLESRELSQIVQKKRNYRPIFYKDDYLLSTDYEESNYMLITDISDLSNITSDSLNFENTPHKFRISNNYGFLTFPDNGLIIMDFNDLGDISELYENPDYDIEDITFYENYALILQNDNTLDIMDINTFEIVSIISFHDSATQVIAYNDYLYAALGNNGFGIYNISDIESPSEFYFAVSHPVLDLYIIDNNLLVHASSNVVYNYDLSVPNIPIMVNRYEHNNGIYISSNFMSFCDEGYDYVDGAWQDFELYDMRNPEVPQIMINWRDVYPLTFSGKDNLLLLDDDYLSTSIYNANQPEGLNFICKVPGYCKTTKIFDNLLFSCHPDNRYYCGTELHDISSLTESIEEPHAEIGTPDEFSLCTYPNPFNSTVSIEAKGAEKIEIYDINGKKVAQFNTNENTNITWTPEEEINSGVYFIKAVQGKLEYSDKIVYIK